MPLADTHHTSSAATISANSQPNYSALQVSQPNANTEYRAWLVDLDGTLYHQTWHRLAMVAELLAGQWGVIRLLRAFRIAQEDMRHNSSPDGNCSYRMQVERVAEQLGVTAEQVQSTVQHWMIDRPLKWLRLFRRRHLIAE